MKKSIYLIMMLLITVFWSCRVKENIVQYAPIETFTNDTLLQTVVSKRAMIVIAHDDDMCAMAGTMALLNNQGWEIAVVSFSKEPERNAAQIKACTNILDTVMFVALQPEQFRNNGYSAIPISGFDTVFNSALIKEHYITAINAFKPEIIFTLDNEMGGYGHPEHVFVSQMVIELAHEKRIAGSYIYQSVYTNHMETSIMKRHSERMKGWGFPGDEWENAKKAYQVSGMPEPDVQIKITSQASAKMDYLRSYNKREQKVLDFFIPFFSKYDAHEYFTIFDREFFRIIKI